MEPISKREAEVNTMLPLKSRKLRKRKSPVVRFLDHVVIQPGDCWLWSGHVSSTGYGYFRYETSYHAHIAAHRLFKGPIPEGYHIDHLCRVRHCVNPDHLEAVTPSQNQLRRPWKACDRLHPLEPARPGIRYDGRVECYECQRAREQARREARRAAGSKTA
jgi:hypothetical protein